MWPRIEPRIEPHNPLSPVPITIRSRLSACSANELLAAKETIAAQAKQIEELTKQLGKVKVKAQPNAECVGLWTSKDKQTVRKVFAGPRGGFHMLTPSKVTLKIHL